MMDLDDELKDVLEIINADTQRREAEDNARAKLASIDNRLSKLSLQTETNVDVDLEANLKQPAYRNPYSRYEREGAPEPEDRRDRQVQESLVSEFDEMQIDGKQGSSSDGGRVVKVGKKRKRVHWA